MRKLGRRILDSHGHDHHIGVKVEKFAVGRENLLLDLAEWSEPDVSRQAAPCGFHDDVRLEQVGGETSQDRNPDGGAFAGATAPKGRRRRRIRCGIRPEIGEDVAQPAGASRIRNSAKRKSNALSMSIDRSGGMT